MEVNTNCTENPSVYRITNVVTYRFGLAGGALSLHLRLPPFVRISTLEPIEVDRAEDPLK